MVYDMWMCVSNNTTSTVRISDTLFVLLVLLVCASKPPATKQLTSNFLKFKQVTSNELRTPLWNTKKYNKKVVNEKVMLAS